MKLSPKSKLYRKLVKQGYLRAEKKGGISLYGITLEGIKVLHLLAERVQIQNISWDFVNAVGMDETHTNTPILKTNQTTLQCAAELTKMAIKSMKEEQE